VNRDGKAPMMISDGEESDTKLMPFYRFPGYDNPVYLNYMHYSMATNNRRYQPEAHAITWAGSPDAPLDKFSWTDFPLGPDRFSLSYERTSQRVRAKLKKATKRRLNTEALLPSENLSAPLTAFSKGILSQVPCSCKYFKRQTIRITSEAAPGEPVEVIVSGQIPGGR
jgi:hypothetical protein